MRTWRLIPPGFVKDGATIIKITGPDNAAKADRLAAEVQRVLAGEAMVARPKVKSELCLFGMDESISTEETKEAIAKKGGCMSEEVKTGRIGRIKSEVGIV